MLLYPCPSCIIHRDNEGSSGHCQASLCYASSGTERLSAAPEQSSPHTVEPRRRAETSQAERGAVERHTDGWPSCDNDKQCHERTMRVIHTHHVAGAGAAMQVDATPARPAELNNSNIYSNACACLWFFACGNNATSRLAKIAISVIVQRTVKQVRVQHERSSRQQLLRCYGRHRSTIL